MSSNRSLQRPRRQASPRPPRCRAREPAAQASPRTLGAPKRLTPKDVRPSFSQLIGTRALPEVPRECPPTAPFSGSLGSHGVPEARSRRSGARSRRKRRGSGGRASARVRTLGHAGVRTLGPAKQLQRSDLRRSGRGGEFACGFLTQRVLSQPAAEAPGRDEGPGKSDQGPGVESYVHAPDSEEGLRVAVEVL